MFITNNLRTRTRGLARAGAMNYKIVTYGCQMNVHESEKLAGLLERAGYSETDDAEDADIIVFNTCCIRDTAERRALGNIGVTKGLKRRHPDLIVAVCGCMPQQKDAAERIASRYPYVDIVLGTRNIASLPAEIDRVLAARRKTSGRRRFADTEYPEDYLDIDENTPVFRTSYPNAWVNIIYGCNNFCTYCIVPYVRGREISRSPEAVLDEVKRAVDEGYGEITLLGQNVNSYGHDLGGVNFARLLREIDKIDGKFRVRFMTSHPKDLDEEVADAMAQSDKICSQIHLPVQSGSNAVLKAMNRRYTREHYLGLVRMLRDKMPDIGITTDIMVGFPTETEEAKYSFDDFVGMEFKVMSPSAYYALDEETGLYYLETDEEKINGLIEERAMTVRISGILRQKKGIAAGCLKGTVVYPSEFAVSFIENNSLQPAVVAQTASYLRYLAIKDDPDIPASQKKVYSVLNGAELNLTIGSTNPNNYFYLLKTYFKVQDTSSPEYVYIYANSVESKEKITNMLNAYNNQNSAIPINQVTFTDNSTAIVNSLSQTVDTVSIILISMTLISVIVAMFMIAIIMYSTVQDRTQEIGILRSIGARQFDIMRIFNVESLMLGFFASIVGIALSNILALPINAILKSTLGISKLILPTWWHALLLFGFSLLLTLISGAIPAIIASKKNPVTALKTD